MTRTLGMVGLLCCVACMRTPATRLTEFPQPEHGEVDSALVDASAQFERAYPKAELLQVASATSAWKVERHEFSGIPLRRKAEVHFGFRIGNACYYQLNLIKQEAQLGDWGAVQLGESLYYNYHKRFQPERDAEYGLRYPIDCAQLEQNSAVSAATPTADDS